MIKIVIRPNPLEDNITTYECPYNSSWVLFDYITGNQDSAKQKLKIAEDIEHIFSKKAINVTLNSHPVAFEKLHSIHPENNDIIAIAFTPQYQFIPLIVSLIATAVSIGLQYALMDKPKPPVIENRAELPESPTYNWDGPATSYAMGRPIPLIYGKHGTGGTLINALTEGVPFGTEATWRKFSDLGNNGLDRALNDYTETVFWGTRSAPRNRLNTFYSNAWSSAPNDLWNHFFNSTYVAGFPFHAPTSNGFFVSLIFDSPWPNGVDYATIARYPNGPKEFDTPLYATKIKTNAQISYSYECGATINLYGWKKWKRYLIWDASEENGKKSSILIPNGSSVKPSAATALSGWFIDERFMGFVDSYVQQDYDVNLSSHAGQEVPVLGSPNGIELHVQKATAEQALLYGISEGTRIFPELWYEGIFLTNYATIYRCTGVNVCGDNHEVGKWIVVGGLPHITDARMYTYGVTSALESDQEKYYSTAVGLRMTIALSDGEICSVGRAKIKSSSDTNEGPEGPPKYKEYSSLFLNDIPIDKLYQTPTMEGYGSPIDIDGSKGGLYPQIKNAPNDYSSLNLFTKRLVNTTSFDFLVGDPDVVEGQTLVYTTTSICSSLEVTIIYKQGMYAYDGTQAVPTTTEFYIKYYVEGGDPNTDAKYWTIDHPTTEETPFIYTNKKTEPHTITINMGTSSNPLPSAMYIIEFYRKDEPRRGGNLYNAFWIQKISEFNFDFLRYPNTALMGMRILPSDVLQGSPPKVNTIVEGRFIQVPIIRVNGQIIPIEECYTVYNSETDTYSWKYTKNTEAEVVISTEDKMYQYTSNPALVVYDLLTTQELYPYITEDVLEWEDFIYAAEFCWEYVSTQTLDTNKEHKFECNLVLDGSIDASTILNQLCAIYRFKLSWIGDKLRLLVLKQEAPTQQFTDADIYEDTYQESYNDLAKIPNTLEVSYYDEDNKYKQEVIQVSRKDIDTNKGEIIKQTFSLLGTTKSSQAKRISNYLLANFEYSNKTITFNTSLRGLVCVPGNVIRVEPNVIPYVYSGQLRKSSSAGTNIYFDSQISIPNPNYGVYSLQIQSSVSGTMYTTALGDFPTLTLNTSQAHNFDCVGDCECSCGSTHTITELTDLPILGDTYQLIPSGTILYSHDYRVEEIKTDLSTNKCTITCSPYNSNVYNESGEWVSQVYIPPVEPSTENYPADVENLQLYRLDNDEVTIKVTYLIPAAGHSTVFSQKVYSATGVPMCDYASGGACTLGCDYAVYPCPYGENSCITCNYTPSTISTTTKYNVEFTEQIKTKIPPSKSAYSLYASDGTYKGKVNFIPSPGATSKTGTVECTITVDTFFSVDEGDSITKVINKNTVPIHHINIYTSFNGIDYSLYGTDNSRGAGYTINLPESAIGKRLWVKAQAYSKLGIQSLHPPTANIEITSTRCLETPAHLSLCGQNDNSIYFVGGDIEICWTKVSSAFGAGRGIEEEAGSTQAGAATDEAIVGYAVYVYENDYATFLTQEEVTTTKYKLTQDINKQLHIGHSQLLEQYGQRSLQFRVYQLDIAGNESCEPAEIEAENTAPTMSGYTPSVSSGDYYFQLDWSSFVNDSSLYESDITGYILYYSKDEQNISQILINGGTTTNYRVNGLDAGTYSIYIVPLDCFGPGSPLASYQSDTVETDVTVPNVGPIYPPDNPYLGMTGDLLITNVIDGGTIYSIFTTTDLSVYGFEGNEEGFNSAQYLALPYHLDRVYYNTNPNIDGYCSVTASNLNTRVNQVRCIGLYDEDTGVWKIDIYPPTSSDITNYGYAVSAGLPVIGQTFSINAWAGLDYASGGSAVVWGMSPRIDTCLHAKWRQPNPEDVDLDEVANFEFDLYDGTTARYCQTYTKSISKDEDYYGTYYEEAISGSKLCTVLDATMSIISSTGHKSANSQSSSWHVNKEVLNITDPITILDWKAVTDTEGQNIQMIINNWEDIWHDPRVERIEVFASPGTWDFNTSEFIDHPDRYDYPTFMENMVLLPYEETVISYGGHQILSTKTVTIPGDDPDYRYCFLGSTNGPIFNWATKATSNTGGACTYWHVVGNYCNAVAGACSGFELGDCPYGYATDNNGVAIDCCTYESSQATSRTVEGVNYNTYYIAVGIRTADGKLIFVSNTSNEYIAKTSCELIDSMHIKNAAITTAKIKDACINNAKIRNLSADKVWIGDSGATWRPFTGQCLYDGGDRCLKNGWLEPENPYSDDNIYYKSGSCPQGPATTATCGYVESDFALQRIFALYGRSPDDFPTNEWSYINGGMILTDSIKARSLQIGALPYIVDLSVIREKDSTMTPTNHVRVRWYKPGLADGVYANGKVIFPGKEEELQIYTDYRTWPYRTGYPDQQLLPDGTTSTTKSYVAYINYLVIADPPIYYVQFEKLSYSGDPNWVSKFRSLGKLPLFVVNIYHKKADAYDLGKSTTPYSILNSSYEGNFRVEITVISPGSGTFITNDDITTGVVHNETYTSLLDLRHYTGLPATLGGASDGSGRLVIDGPSSVYARNISKNYRDPLGKAWWQHSYNSTRDTKLLIGKPYFTGLGTSYSPEWTEAQTEGYCDQGYLWFYRTYEGSKWVGTLEVGGSLRVKLPSENFEMLVGKKYKVDPTDPTKTIQAFHPTLNIYDTTKLGTGILTSDLRVATIGRETLSTAGGATLAGISAYFDAPIGSNATVVIDKQTGVNTISSVYASNKDYSLLIVPPNTTSIASNFGSIGLAIQGRSTGQNKIWAGLVINTKAKYGIIIDSTLVGESPDVGIYIGNNTEGKIGLQIDPPNASAPVSLPTSFVQMRLGASNIITPSKTGCSAGDIISTNQDLWWYDGTQWRRLAGTNSGEYGPITLCQFADGSYVKTLWTYDDNYFPGYPGKFWDQYAGQCFGTKVGYTIPIVIASSIYFNFYGEPSSNEEDFYTMEYNISVDDYLTYTLSQGPGTKGVLSCWIDIVVFTYTYLIDLMPGGGPF